MSFLNHIGATAYKFEIELVVVKVQLGTPSSNSLLVEWKRGSSVARTGAVAGDKQTTYDFGKRALKITSTMYKKKDKWQKKESTLTVKSIPAGGKGKSEDRLGVVEFDLAQYVDQSEAGVSESLTLPLQKCSDKGARITFRLLSRWLRGAEVHSDDEPSRSTNAASQLSQSRESSLNGSPGATGLDRLDGDNSDEDDAPPPPKKGGGRAAAAAAAPPPQTDSDADDEDARRRIRFNKQSLGRTGADAPSASAPKKSNLKGSAGGGGGASLGGLYAKGKGRDEDEQTDSDADADAAPPVKRPTAAAPAPVARRPAESSEEHDDEEEEEDEGGIPLFGVTLGSIMAEQKDVSPDLDIPLVLDVLVRGIEKLGGLGLEGLFRISPPTRAREELKQKFEQGDYRMPRDAHVAAALLKLWLGELKEPVWPEKLNAPALELGKLDPSTAAAATSPAAAAGDDDSENSDSDDEYAKRKRAKAAAAKKAAASSPEAAQVAEQLRSLLPKLPSLHLRVLARLLGFLARVSSPPALNKTKMTPQALAVVFAPNLLRLRVPDVGAIGGGAGSAGARKAQEEYVAESKRAVNFVQHLQANVALVEAAARGELRSSPTSGVAAAATPSSRGGRKPAAAATVDSEEDDDQQQRGGSGSGRRPLQSFAGADESDEEDDESTRRPASVKSPPSGSSGSSRKPTSPPQDTDESDGDAPPPPAKAKSPASGAAAAASAKSPPSATSGKSPSPLNSSGRAGAGAGRGAAANKDDTDDSDEEAAKRSELFRKRGAGAGGATSPPSASDAAPQNIKDALFAKKGGGSAASSKAAAAAKNAATDSDESHSDDDEDEEDDAYAARQREANKKKTDAIAKGSAPSGVGSIRAAEEQQAVKERQAQLAREAAAVKNKPSSAKSAFGESDDDEDDSGSDEGQPPRTAPTKKPSPPAAQPPAPSPRSAAAKAAAASSAKSPSSSSSSSAEADKLRAALAELQAHAAELEAHIVELEDAAEANGGAAAQQKLTKENAKLKAENAELKRSTPSHANTAATAAAAAETAASLAAAEQRIAELEETARTNAVQLKQKDELIRRQKEQIDQLQADLDHALESSSSSSRKKGATAARDTEELHSLREQVRVLEDLRTEHEHKEDILARMAAAAAENQADMAPTPTRRAFAESAGLRELERHVQELEASVVSKDDAIRALETQLAAANAAAAAAGARSPPSARSTSSSKGGNRSDDERHREPELSPQFDRHPSFGVRDAGDGFGDINTSAGSRGSSAASTPRHSSGVPPPGVQAPPPPPPPPASVTAATAALRKQLDALTEQLEQRDREIKKLQRRGGGDDFASSSSSGSTSVPSELLSQLSASLSILAEATSAEPVRASLAKAQALLASKDARVKELAKELRRKDDEIEQFLAIKTAELGFGGDEQAAASSSAVEDEEIDWPSLSDRQKVKKGQALQRLAKERGSELKAVSLRVRQLDAELDDLVDGHKARKGELKRCGEELAHALVQIDALKAQAQAWKDVETHLRSVVAQLAQGGGSIGSSSSGAVSSPSGAMRTLQAELEAVQDELADSVAQVAKLERENARLNKDLEEQRLLESSGPSSGKSSDSALKKQVASLLSERDELVRELDESDAKAAEARRAALESKKACRAHTQEIEDLKQQLAEAGTGAGGRSSRSPASSRASFGASSVDEQQLREELSLLQLRLEEAVSDAEEKIAAERKLKNALMVQVQSLRQETEALRLRAVRFDDLSVIPSHMDPKKNAKDKLQMDLIAAYEALVKRERFLEQQLKECDNTLTTAKGGWVATIALMAEQCTALEGEVAELKAAAAAAAAAATSGSPGAASAAPRVPIDQQQMDLLQKKLRKAESARAKMQELLSAAEAELGKKKSELSVAHQSLIALQTENKKVKEELVRSGLALKTIAEDNFELKEHVRLMHGKGKK